MTKELRIGIFNDTELYYNNGNCPFVEGDTTTNQLSNYQDVQNDNETTITVDNIDCIEKSRLFSELGKTLLLNMASDIKPGGGVRNEAMAQEEEICRRSNLVFQLETQEYPLLYDEYIYSKNVTFFKDSKYQYIDHFNVDVITIAALNMNRNIPTNYREIMIDKIEQILKSAQSNSIEYLVLSAFGCGVFRNDPLFISNTFKDIINSKFKGVFKSISFAILNDRNSVGDNFNIFKNIIE